MKMKPCSFLHIDLKYDGLCWIHLSDRQNRVTTLQELPPPLRRRVSRLFHKWTISEFKDVFFFSGNKLPFLIDGKPHTSKDLEMRNQQIESLQLIAWWIEYTRRREDALVRLARLPKSKQSWTCIDCGEAVETKRIACTNHKCYSWNKIFKCTRDPVFNPKTNRLNT